MRFILLLLPILMFFSFREQSQSAEVGTTARQRQEKNITPFEVYPNPVSNMLTLYSSAFQDEKTRLFIFDVSGNLVLRKDSLHFNEHEITKVDLSQLNPGLYFVQLRIKNYSATKKIVKI